MCSNFVNFPSLINQGKITTPKPSQIMDVDAPSGNSPPNGLNINCSCYGSNVLIRFDTLDILRSQFQKFEKRFRNNEHTYYDLKLPTFIIQSFSKLWKLWKEIPEFQELIEVKVFYEIFADMLPFFPNDNAAIPDIVKNNSQSTNFDVVCNECDESIPIINDDFSLSYDLHLQTSLHAKATEKKHNGIGASQCSNDLNGETKSVTSDAGRENSNDASCSPPPPWLKKKPVKTEALKFGNWLPPATVTSSLHALNSSSSSASTQLSKASGSRTSHKLPTADDPYCSVCCRKVIGTKEVLSEHPIGKPHIRNLELLDKCQTLLNLNKPYVTILDRNRYEFNCALCDKRQSGTNCFVQHFKSKEHLSNMKGKIEDPAIELTERISLAPFGSAFPQFIS